ncbi:MAG: ATP-binding protein [bacterium]|nr:ATP-binding protein [bacterium]
MPGHLYHRILKALGKSSSQNGAPKANSVAAMLQQPLPALHRFPRLADVLKSITNGLLVCDGGKVVLLTNPALETIIGLSSKDTTIESFFQTFDCTELDLGKKLDEVLSGGVSVYIDDLCLDSSIYEMFINPVRSDAGEILGAAIVVHDVTPSKEADRVKTEFLSIAAHQLRTPLGSMRWNIEMLLNGDMGELSKKIRGTLMEVYQGTQRMIILVSNLLTVSRIDQGRVPEQPSKVDVVEVIKDVIREVEFSTVERSERVELKIGSSRIPKIFLDSQRLRDVVQNLISNAVKYNRFGEKVVVRVDFKDDFVNLSFHDKGIGIPKKEQGKLFSKFFRASNAAHSRTEGNGLGLFIVKSYIEGWGGKVWFESEEGKGTTFYISLPKVPHNGVLSEGLLSEKV